MPSNSRGCTSRQKARRAGSARPFLEKLGSARGSIFRIILGSARLDFGKQLVKAREPKVKISQIQDRTQSNIESD